MPMGVMVARYESMGTGDRTTDDELPQLSPLLNPSVTSKSGFG
jgi:hypothetical protein